MKSTGGPQGTIRPLSGITPEQARHTRARAWAYVLDCFNCRVSQEGGPPTAPDSAKGGSSDSSAKTIIPKHL